jgi:GNAT superfamily N-acetyltransferase
VGVDAETAAHDRRLLALDPLLPKSTPLRPPAAGEVALSVPSAAGIYRRQRLDLDSMAADERAADVHMLDAHVIGPEPVGAMAALLARWDERIAASEFADDDDSEALIRWPSRDTSLTSTFLAHGLVPTGIRAVRPAGRPTPAGSAGVTVRALRSADLDAAVELALALARWNAQFGGRLPRPSTEAHYRRIFDRRLNWPAPWVWVAEVAGAVTGTIVVNPPEWADFATAWVASGPVAYVGALVVGAGHRGDGVGAALVTTAHTALDAAGVAVTLLDYYALNPLSVPFWHRCGYRPLSTEWTRRPARPA